MNLRRALQALLFAALLMIVLNPELRALLLLTNALGLEITLILMALQWRALLAGAVPFVRESAAIACSLASRLGYLGLSAWARVVPIDLFNRLLCPALITVSYGLTCRARRIRASSAHHFG